MRGTSPTDKSVDVGSKYSFFTYVAKHTEAESALRHSMQSKQAI